MTGLSDYIDMSEYRDLFASEAQEHLETIDAGLLALEQNPTDGDTLKTIFRASHTLKGMAATMGYQDLAQVAHTLEDLLDDLRSGQRSLTPALADVLFAGVDALKTLLADALADRPPSLDTETLVQQLTTSAAAAAEHIPLLESPTASVSEPDSTPPAEQRVPTPTLKVSEATQTIRINTQHLDTLLNLVAELVISRSRLWRIQQRHNLADLREALEQHDRLLEGLRDAVFQMRMVPVARVFNRFPRMVRDLLRERGKEADFIIEGDDIELDRTILERVSDPLLHLLRNAVDHGVEPPEERERLGKPRRATIRLRARRERESVIIEVSDDGQGMDRDHIVEVAVQRGVIDPAEAKELSNQQALALICHPGFSTAQHVTDVSGRGVGMDVVRRQIEALHGSLYIETEPGKGTTFRLRLPLTLAIIQALLVKAGPEMYAVPLSQVEHILEIEPGQVKQVQRWQITTDEEARPLPLLELRELLEIPGNGTERTTVGYAMVVGENRERLGVVVDELISQEEIVIRPLPDALMGIPGLAGASILGEGQVVLILDIPNLVQIPAEPALQP